ncbi:FAD binding domain-containing protein [Anaeroselena agilis]|uniref:FAD binding domain-containing protein n=1 Tax=Anaeroselena agilis TaxID=3063788 RepID=A0ABU3P1N5_9FIRM|nr:FAD binding domain-containing protein [Selenomonadales bacterium 4137-cl]
MFTVKELVRPQTLAEAYRTLTEHPDNALLGGCAFLRLGNRKIAAAVDLSRIGLDYIRETEGFIEVGAMATFRALENHPACRENFSGMLPRAVGNVLGVQFRNLVTVGASVFSKYGFSDLITALLALDTDVELHAGGRMPLAVFLDKPYTRDILTRIYIRKDGRAAAYQSLRNSASDFPVVNAAVARLGDRWTVAVGARPAGARLAPAAAAALDGGADPGEAAALAAGELAFGGNLKASAEYRRAMAAVLVKRAVLEVSKCASK